jgi:transcriptional regulator with XRE-family HTH domain
MPCLPLNRHLGAFLRSRRVKLQPADVGLRAGRVRRTPGLLREEVAQLAGISTEWYIRLEQGRTVSPSAATIAALAAALQLDEMEHHHLRSLARGGEREPFVRETVSDALRGVVEGLTEPAYVTGQRWDVLAWNAAAADLLTDFGLRAVGERNILLFMFTDGEARRLFGTEWATEARRMLSLFRATHDLWPGDPSFDEVVERLRAGCAEFDLWWADHGVTLPRSGSKKLHLRSGDTVIYEYSTFQANDDPSLKLALYVARG